MEIRKLCPEEWGAAAALVWQVFQRFEAPEYPPQGMEAFRSFLEDRQGLLPLGAWAAWEGEKLIGVLASRREGSPYLPVFRPGGLSPAGNRQVAVGTLFGGDLCQTDYRSLLAVCRGLLPPAGLSGYGGRTAAGWHPFHPDGIHTLERFERRRYYAQNTSAG